MSFTYALRTLGLSLQSGEVTSYTQVFTFHCFYSSCTRSKSNLLSFERLHCQDMPLAPVVSPRGGSDLSYLPEYRLYSGCTRSRDHQLLSLNDCVIMHATADAGYAIEFVVIIHSYLSAHCLYPCCTRLRDQPIRLWDLELVDLLWTCCFASD